MRRVALAACVAFFASVHAFVCGDAFAGLADHIYGPEGFHPERVARGDVIFVRGRLLDHFFDQAEIAITEPYILITHNSDLNITEAYGGYFASPHLFHWFAQNCVGLEHPRVTPIPIGLMNPTYYKGQGEHFRAILAKLTDLGKPYLVSYLGCKVRRVAERRRAEAYFREYEGCNFQNKQPFHTYLQMVAQSRFVVCPEGAGFDTHRCWEALYLGAYPIVKHSAMDRLFEELPVLLVSDWEEVSDARLLEAEAEFKGRRWSGGPLCMAYWKERIEQERAKCRRSG